MDALCFCVFVLLKWCAFICALLASIVSLWSMAPIKTLCFGAALTLNWKWKASIPATQNWPILEHFACCLVVRFSVLLHHILSLEWEWCKYQPSGGQVEIEINHNIFLAPFFKSKQLVQLTSASIYTAYDNWIFVPVCKKFWEWIMGF